MAQGQQKREAKRPEERPIPTRFESWRIAAYLLIFSVFGIASTVGGSRFWDVMFSPSSAESMPIYIVRLVLFGELVLYSIRWVYATNEELGMWLRWLEHPPIPEAGFAAMGVVALYLGVQMALVHKIVYLSGIFAAFIFINYWTQWICNKHFDSALEISRKKHAGSSRRMQVLDAMQHYWQKLPQLARITTTLFVASIAFSLALAGAVSHKSAYQLAAYIVLITDILISEFAIFVWRSRLDKDIEQAWPSKA